MMNRKPLEKADSLDTRAGLWVVAQVSPWAQIAFVIVVAGGRVPHQEAKPFAAHIPDSTAALGERGRRAPVGSIAVRGGGLYARQITVAI
jgi:hypothetical protein